MLAIKKKAKARARAKVSDNGKRKSKVRKFPHELPQKKRKQEKRNSEWWCDQSELRLGKIKEKLCAATFSIFNQLLLLQLLLAAWHENLRQKFHLPWALWGRAKRGAKEFYFVYLFNKILRLMARILIAHSAKYFQIMWQLGRHTHTHTLESWVSVSPLSRCRSLITLVFCCIFWKKQINCSQLNLPVPLPACSFFMTHAFSDVAAISNCCTFSLVCFVFYLFLIFRLT